MGRGQRRRMADRRQTSLDLRILHVHPGTSTAALLAPTDELIFSLYTLVRRLTRLSGALDDWRVHASSSDVARLASSTARAPPLYGRTSS